MRLRVPPTFPYACAKANPAPSVRMSPGMKSSVATMYTRTSTKGPSTPLSRIYERNLAKRRDTHSMKDSRKPEIRLKSRITHRITPRMTKIIGMRGSHARQLQHFSFGFCCSSSCSLTARDRFRSGERSRGLTVVGLHARLRRLAVLDRGVALDGYFLQIVLGVHF